MSREMTDETENYDRCKRCGHTWHGLSCTVYAQVVSEDGKVVSSACHCPSQFKLEEE